jgi:hypothetical protein
MTTTSKRQTKKPDPEPKPGPRDDAPLLPAKEVTPTAATPSKGESAGEYLLFLAMASLPPLKRRASTLAELLCDALGLGPDELTDAVSSVQQARGWRERLAKLSGTLPLEVSLRAAPPSAPIEDPSSKRERLERVDWALRRLEIRDQAWRSAELLIDKATTMLKAGLEPVIDDEGRVIAIPRWNIRDAAALLDTADKLQRLSADMADSKLEVTVSHVDALAKMLQGILDQGATLEQARILLQRNGVDPSDLEAAQQLLDGFADAQPSLYNRSLGLAGARPSLDKSLDNAKPVRQLPAREEPEASS